MANLKAPGKSIDRISCAHLNDISQHFALYSITDFVPKAEELSHLHRHNYDMLLFNVTGSGKHVIDFSTHEIEPLSITCMHPGQLHKWVEYDSLEGYIVFFEKEFYALHYQAYQLTHFHFFSYRHLGSYLQVDEQVFYNCLAVIRLMVREYNSKMHDYEKSLRSYLNILLIEINRLLRPANMTSERSQTIELVSNFKELIEQHFREKHLVKEYAELLFVRPNYLNSVCTAVTGSSAGELIRDRILIEAKRILVYEQKTIAELSYELGFVDNSYFGRFFKKYLHCSPDKFKKQSI